MHDTIGVDISNDTLDIHRLSDGKHIRFGNDKAGLAALRRWIGKTRVRVVYESTGRYHRDMEGVLDTAGHALVKVNPGRARRFAQAAGYPKFGSRLRFRAGSVWASLDISMG